MRSMLFSAKAEYACIAMLELAARYDDPNPVRLKTISDAHEIPLRFLVQILLQLKGAGLVISARGAAGGYLLARPPEKVTIGQIVGVIDRAEPAERPRPRRKPAAEPEPKSDTKEKKPPKIGSMPNTAAVATVRGVWSELQAAQQRILDETTLAELVRRSQADQGLMYQI
jgi:Rrf2 family protein